MREIKILLVTFIFAFTYSCSNDDASIDNTNEFNIEKAYYKVINSENSKLVYEDYSIDEKAKLWKFKYHLFIAKSGLTKEQVDLVNELKNIAVQTIVNENVNENKLELIQSRLTKKFDNDQYFDLLYFLDNPSLNKDKRNCFWCTMFATTSDCYYDEHGDPVQDADFYNVRFWISSYNSSGTVPCQDGSIVLQGN